MKIIKTASGKKTIKISKKEWESIGKKAGWMKKAKFGEYMENEGGEIWNRWKSKGYLKGANEPTAEQAIEFNNWVENLIDSGNTQFMPVDEDHRYLWKKLDKIRNSVFENIEKALNYQAALYEIEQASVVL